jgi:hypothetical protein
MRTAHVPRPGGDPPADDAFDLYASDLAHLLAVLRA